MEVKSSVGLAVGPANANHWGQVLVMPTAYGVVEIEDPEGHAQQLGVAALSFLGESLSRGITSLASLEGLADRVATVGLKTLVLLVPVGKIVYLVLRGKGGVFVKRGVELASLMHEDSGLSGELREGDVFLLASMGFSNLLSHDELSSLFDHLSAADIAEKLTILLHEKTNGEGSVALVFGATQFIERETVPSETTEVRETASEPNEQPMGHAPFTMPPSITSRITRLRRLPVTERIKQYVVSLRQRPNERMRALAVLLGVFFILSVILGIWKQQTMKKNQELLTALSDAQHSFDEGVALGDLNPLKGRERLLKAKDTLTPFLKTISPRSSEGQQLSLLYGKITDNLTQVMQVTNSSLSLYYDMTLLKKGAVASDMARDGDTLAIADAKTQTMYDLTISSKNAQIVGGGSALKSIISVGIHGDTIYALTPDGITSFDMTTNKSSLIIKKDPSWGFVTSIVSFGGNLYVLDTQKSRIWKYVATDTGFSEIREYLNPDTLPDLSLATNMVIDGSVWLGSTDGKIWRFTQGRDNSIMPQGVDPAFGQNLSIYTSDDAQNVYVLDTQHHRVVILDKTGMYLAQYQFDSKVLPTKLVVSESAKIMLLLADGKIYALPLK